MKNRLLEKIVVPSEGPLCPIDRPGRCVAKGCTSEGPFWTPEYHFVPLNMPHWDGKDLIVQVNLTLCAHHKGRRDPRTYLDAEVIEAICGDLKIHQPDLSKVKVEWLPLVV